MDHTKSHWLNGRSRETTVNVAQNWTVGPWVDGHTQEGIDKADPISTTSLTGTSNFSNIRYIRRQLDNNRLICLSTNSLSDRFDYLRVHPKGHTLALYIRTGYINF